jgi:sec-independent protein translocase protein TatC
VPRAYDESWFDSTKMTFGEHLDELRSALIKAILSLALGFLVALLFAGQVVDYVQTPLKAALSDFYTRLAKQEYLDYLHARQAHGAIVPKDMEAAAQLLADEGLIGEQRYIDPLDLASALASVYPGVVNPDALPARDQAAPVERSELVPLRMYHDVKDDPRVRVIGLAVHEPFSVYIKAAFVCGAILASPFVFYFLWRFVAVGLYPHEQKYVHVFLPISVGLFLAGALLAFFVVFRFVLAFLFTFYDWMGIDPDPRITDWLTFVLILPLGFGISFQLPLVMLFLERIGIFSLDSYTTHWRIAVLVIFILSMILTPTDPGSMLLMAIPLTALYFGGILMCRLMPRSNTPFRESTD